MTWKVPLFEIYWDENDINSVTNVIRRGSFWANGSEIEEFENKLAEYVGRKYALTFNSGTSALHALLLSYGIKPGDEIIVPSFTFISTANAPLFVGAKPVFAEIEDQTLGLDPEDVKERISSKTKAIIPIHYAGCPCLINELKEIAEDYRLLLIEDAAESLGAKIKDKNVGTFGDSTILSFCQNKIISTGEGGAITLDSKETYERLKLIRSHGRLDIQNYFDTTELSDYITIGYNFRMSTMTAALGVSQLLKIKNMIEMRRENAKYISEKLSHINDISLPCAPTDYFHVYQMYTILVNENLRNDFIKYLSNEGIMSKVYFPSTHLTYFYKTKFEYKEGDYPITEKLSRQVVSLPMYPTLTKQKIDYVVEKIHSFFRGKL